MTFNEFKTRLLAQYSGIGAEFRVRELGWEGYQASPQQMGGWLRRLASEGEVRYLGNETVHKGGVGHRRDYYPAEPYWVTLKDHDDEVGGASEVHDAAPLDAVE